MLAVDSAKSGNQKVQVLRAVTFSLIGKGTPKVTLLKGLSSFSTFFYPACLFGAQHFLPSFFLSVGTEIGTRALPGLILGVPCPQGPSLWWCSVEVCQLT
jgi:hypothetical protein